MSVHDSKHETVIVDGPEAEELRRQLQKEKTAEEDRIRAEESHRKQEEYNLRVKAVVETVLAFHRRGVFQQYDSTVLVNAFSREGSVGTRRATDHVSPEDATLNSYSYLVCSTFVYNVYYEAIGFKLCGHPDQCACKNHYKQADQSIVYYWRENDGESLRDAIKTVRSILRPGDILTSSKATAHNMLFLGDYLGDGVEYIAHSWGGKYSMETGKDSFETMGTVRIQPVDELCFTEGNKDWYKKTKTPRWSMYDNMREIAVIRPLRAHGEEEYPLTANARARLAYPGLNITRTADINPYDTAMIDELITYTLVVENNSKSDYSDIKVEEKIPVGTVVADAGGADVNGNKLCWNLEIPAGESACITYRVKICAEAGDLIISEGGNVAGIRSNRIVTHVGVRLEASLEEKLKALASETGLFAGQELTGIGMCRRVYEEILGQPLELPDESALIRELVFSTTGKGAYGPLVARKKLGSAPALEKVLIPRYQGGRMLITHTSALRILEFDLRYLRPGDILVYAMDPLGEQKDIRVYLYLGDGAFGYMTDAGMAVTTEDILWPAFREDLFFALRPSLANT